MIDLFDQLGNQLNEAIGTGENNNVGWAHKQVFGYDEGGVVGSTDTSSNNTTTDISNNDNNTPDWLKMTIGAAAKTANNSGRQDTSYMGGNFYNSPAYLAARYSDLGKFFTQSEPGNLYTNRYEQPQKSQPTKALTGSDFFNRWYERMRNFAEASEVSSRGQTQTRTI